GGDEAEIPEMDVLVHERQKGQTRLQPLERDEGLRPRPLGQAELLDGEIAREEVEIDVLDGDLAAHGLGHLPHHDLAHDLGKRGEEAHDHQRDHHDEREAERAEPGEPAAKPTHAGYTGAVPAEGLRKVHTLGESFRANPGEEASRYACWAAGAANSGTRNV